MNSEANKKLLEEIRALKSDHPSWGYRRIWAYLRRHQYKGARINHKRVYRLMRENNLLVPKNPRLKAVRTPTSYRRIRASKPSGRPRGTSLARRYPTSIGGST